MDLDSKIAKIKMLILDVDGVLTDGSLLLGCNDLEMKSFNIQDGFGIKVAQRAGLKFSIITGRTSEVVSRRADELGIRALYQGVPNKMKAFNEIKVIYDLGNDEIAYIGDDLIDLPVMNRCGLSIAVSNAREDVKERADYVTRAAGGQGAVREVIDMLLKKQDKWNTILEDIMSYE